MDACDSYALVQALYPAMIAAGRLEMQHFKTDVRIETKADKSPVTVADREAEAILVAALTTVMPDVAIVAEEAVAAGNIPAKAERFFLVDALDGTRLFISGKPEFSVNIGLVDGGKPVFGMIYIPPTGDLYFTRGAGQSFHVQASCTQSNCEAFEALTLSRLKTRTPDLANLKAYNSRSASAVGLPLLEKLNVKHAEPVGSSLKFCLIAAGQGDIYARLGQTCEWDTAAGHAILEAAGGTVTTDGGGPLMYGKASTTYRNPHFVAWAGAPLVTAFGAE